MSRRYQAVSAVEREAPTASPARRFRDSPALERFSTKLQAAAWVVGAALTAHYGQLFTVMWDSQKSNSAFIYLGWLCVTVGLAIMGYCTIYLPHIARVGLPFEIYAPQLVPVATVAGVIAFLSFIIGLWPAYGFLSPIVVMVLGMGCLMSAHFIPWG